MELVGDLSADEEIWHTDLQLGGLTATFLDRIARLKIQYRYTMMYIHRNKLKFERSYLLISKTST